MASPTTPPSPVTTFRTPAGRPASSASSARRTSVSDAVSAGFSTTVLPAASAGPSFHAPIISGKFPRHDSADHTDGFPVNEPQGVVSCRGNLAVDLVDGLRVVPDRTCSRKWLGLQRHADFRAVVAHAEHGKQVQRVFLNQCRPLQQDLLARCRRHAGPAPVLEGPAGRGNRGIRVVLAARCHGGQNLAVQGRDDVHFRTACGLAAFAVDDVHRRWNRCMTELFDTGPYQTWKSPHLAVVHIVVMGHFGLARPALADDTPEMHHDEKNYLAAAIRAEIGRSTKSSGVFTRAMAERSFTFHDAAEHDTENDRHDRQVLTFQDQADDAETGPRSHNRKRNCAANTHRRS